MEIIIDFIYIDDAVDYVFSIMNKPKKENLHQVFNISGGISYKLKEV